MPAGNFLLCLSILLVGGSATKVFQMFSHMGLGHVSLNTFFKCQRVSEDILIILKDIWHDTLNGSFNSQKRILTICVTLNIFTWVDVHFLQTIHFQNKLFPAIYLYWQRYQTSMLKKLKDLKDGITISGDGRHDSIGHGAKYCAYTIFCCTVPMIIHFSLVQVSCYSIFNPTQIYSLFSKP